MLSCISFRPFFVVVVAWLLLGTAITVVHADEQSITWIIPTTPYEALTVSVGDVLTFSWPTGSTHDVHKQSTAACPADLRFLAEHGDDHGDDHGDHEHGDDAVMLGDTSPVSYTVTAEDAGKTLYFTCLVGQHCAAGMNMAVTVQESAATTPGPTAASGGATASWTIGGIHVLWTSSSLLVVVLAATLWI